MLQTRSRGYSTGAACILGLVGFMTSAPASAQVAWGYLVRQDFSDCENRNVNLNDPNLVRGTIGAVRNDGGSLSVKVGITGTVNTSYNFYLKCVRQLGTIKTDDEGSGVEVFEIPAGDVRPIITFDMYPNGAPAGNKFQSTQVKF